MPPDPHIPLARYRDDPVAFVRDVLPDSGEPYAKQRETLELLAQERKTSVVGCYASGKDWTAARAILWWLETRAHAKVVVTGPTQRQIEEIVWREMRIAYKSASVPLSGKMLRNRYEIDDDRLAIGFSTNRPENLQGFHSPNMMVVVTEAHGMKPAFEEALKRLNPSKVLLVGNALSTSGEFYESHRALRSRYKRVKISAYDTPAFTGEPIEIYGLMNEEDIADREADTGATIRCLWRACWRSSRTRRTIRSRAGRRWTRRWRTTRRRARGRPRRRMTSASRSTSGLTWRGSATTSRR